MQRNYLRDTLICLTPIVLAGWIVTNAYLKYRSGEGGFKLGVDLSGGTILVYEVDKERTLIERQRAADADQDVGAQPDQVEVDIAGLAASLKRRIDPTDLRNITIRPVGQTRIEIILPTGVHRATNLTQEEVQNVKDLIAQVGSLEFRILANAEDDAEAIRAAEEFLKSAETDPEVRDLLRERARAGLPPPPPPGEFTALGEPATYAWAELGRQEREDLGLSNRFETDDDPNGLWERVAAARQRGEPYLHRSEDTRSGRGVRYSMLIWSREFEKTNPRPDEEGKKYEYFLLTRSSDSVKVGGNVSISAYATQDEQLNPAVGFTFNSVGANQFYTITSKNVPTDQQGVQIMRNLAIILDGQIISAPTINSAISDRGIIQGRFTQDQVNRLVSILRAGALPATLNPMPVSENTIGPTLGADTIRAGTRAIIVSYIAIFAFLMVYYRFAGVVAAVALMANLLLTVAFMILVDATFTLPGLAGLALTIAMASDSNILIYERIREERDRGATLTTAIRNGYDRAFSAIIDTHLTSIFTAVVLYAVGNDQLKGFGVSLTAGLVISLFTTLFLTRLIFDYFVARRVVARLRMLRFFSRPNINFMRIRNYMFTTTAVLTLLGLGLFLLRGQAGLNVDFVGGTAYGGQLRQDRPLTIGQLRDKLADAWQEQMLQVQDVKKVEDPSGRFRYTYEITYDDGQTVQVSLANPPAGATEEEQLADVRARASVLPDASVEQVFLSGQGGIGGASRYFTVRTTEREPELVQVSIDRLFREQNEQGEWVSLLAKAEMNFHRQGSEWVLEFADANDPDSPAPTSPAYLRTLLDREFQAASAEELVGTRQPYELRFDEEEKGQQGRFARMFLVPLHVPWQTEQGIRNVGAVLAMPPLPGSVLERAVTLAAASTAPDLPLAPAAVAGAAPVFVLTADTPPALADPTLVRSILADVAATFNARPQPERLETFDGTLAAETRTRALYAILASWVAILLYLWFRFGSWTFGLAAVLCLIHDLCFALGVIALCHYLYDTPIGPALMLQDFKIDLAAVAALLTLVGYSVNDTIVIFDRIREVRGKNPSLTPPMINDSINQTLSRTLLSGVTTLLVSLVLYIFAGEGVHLFSLVMIIGVLVGTYSSIYVAAPLLLIFGEGRPRGVTARVPEPGAEPERAPV